MTSSHGGAGSGEPDMALINTLFEDIQQNPPAIAARKVLVEHYIAVGWLDAATENASELDILVPGDSDVKRYLATLSKKPLTPAPSASPSIAQTNSRTPKENTVLTPQRKPAQPPMLLPANLDSSRQDLSQGYTSLRKRAKNHLIDLLHLHSLRKKSNLPQTRSDTGKVQGIAEGKSVDAPTGARSVARQIKADPKNALDLVIKDLETTMSWLRAPHGQSSGRDDDSVREALVKRVTALESSLPDNLKFYPEVAFMHVQHEHLNKAYVNDETMYGDEVKDIRRENFWVTEDNYAWDMEELAQAITANNGVMRNPLSRQMFTPKDIRGIVNHPHGKDLRALQVEQHEMALGVRPATITALGKLAEVLLRDHTDDQLPSRRAVDEFMAYIATLPELEQKALDGLKVPAKDKHTGNAYDFSIGQSVRDAKGNRVCFHKAGDFLNQAAVYLAGNQGNKPPDAETQGCVMM